MSDLGSLSTSANATTASQANAVNSHGDMVGWSYLSGSSGQMDAIIYTGGVMYDLNTLYPSTMHPGFTMNVATDINDNGWITGYGTDSSGNLHGFLLYTPTPEPSALLLAASGLLGLLAYAWRKRK